ncbi:MAG: hypothetical protein QOJ07_2961 [Thermoleophilaceae bacterium]|jgi:hypothetical protein|nr:hypothetical protein [Thermoleophilaceae bacterium]
MLLLARIIRLIAMVAAGIIVAGILLFVLGANQGNQIVSAVTDAGRWLVGPFDSLFKIHDAKVEMAVNWGIAAAVWAFVGSLLARLVVAVGGAGRGFGRRRTVA